MVKQLNNLLHNHQLTISTYNSECNGKVERANRSLMEKLRRMKVVEDWPVMAHYAAYLINNTISTPTGLSSFFTLFSRHTIGPGKGFQG